MRKPTTGHGRNAVPEQTPPGGRALERVKQDRLARQLPSPPAPGELILADDTAAATTGSKPRAKAAKTTHRA